MKEKIVGRLTLILFTSLLLKATPLFSQEVKPNAIIAPVGNISGFVFESDGVTPIAGAVVRAEAFDFSFSPKEAISGPDGSYLISDLSALYSPQFIDYRVSAQHPDFGKEYYDNTDLQGAVRLHLTTGQTIENINFTLESMQPQMDTDGDGLFDLWETSGIDGDGDGSPDFFLQEADPGTKDIYVEIDYIDSSRPRQDAIDEVIKAFADAPEPINLHVDIDDGDMLPHDSFEDKQTNTVIVWNSDLLALDDSLRINYHGFDYLKSRLFGTDTERENQALIKAKKKAYRYCLSVPSFIYIDPDNGKIRVNNDCTYNTGTSGVAEGGGNDFVVAHFNQGNLQRMKDQAGTFMHELGHTLGLDHGGSDGVSGKPNYLSVMSYTYQYSWILERNPLFSSKEYRLDYSRVEYETLHEYNLFELDGIQPATEDYVKWIDTDGDGQTKKGDGPLNWNGKWDLPPRISPFNDEPVAVNLNSDFFMVQNECGASIETTPILNDLKGHNDWQNLEFNFRNSGVFGDGVHTSGGSGADVLEIGVDELYQLALSFPDFIAIDVKPEMINLKNRGVIPINVLTTPVFDATTIDPLSAELGPGKAKETHGKGHTEDVDGDGNIDLVLHFRTQESGILCGSDLVYLRAKTFEGQVVEGEDAIITVGCKMEKDSRSAGITNKEVPKRFALHQNYPNPFNPVTEIFFDVPEATKATLTVYNSVGQKIALLINDVIEPGTHRVKWDATNQPSGVYFCELVAGSFRQVRKMSLLR